MSVYVFSEELGNAYVVGIGRREIAKFWFDAEEENQSSSPLTKDVAKTKAEELVDEIKETIVESSLTVEEYGDSDEAIESIRIKNKLARNHHDRCCDDDCDDDSDDGELSFDEFMKFMMLKAMLSD